MRGPDLGVLIITHYTRILQFIKPDFVHVLVDGLVVRSGGADVADQLERTGYSEWVDEPAVQGGAGDPGFPGQRPLGGIPPSVIGTGEEVS